MIRLLSSARAALAAVGLTCALSSGANAAVYVFTGKADFQGSSELAAAFGLSADGLATFSAILDIDDYLSTDGALYSLIDDETRRLESITYAWVSGKSFNSFEMSLGNQSWSYVGRPAEHGYISFEDGGRDGTDDSYDDIRIWSSVERSLPGITIGHVEIEAFDWDETAFTGIGVDALDHWNDVADIETVGWGPFDHTGGSIATNLGYVWLGEISMTKLTSGVPEPATWLMMIMGFGLAGIASRRRRALAA